MNLDRTVPGLAAVHFFGHSQKGIVANDLRHTFLGLKVQGTQRKSARLTQLGPGIKRLASRRPFSQGTVSAPRKYAVRPLSHARN